MLGQSPYWLRNAEGSGNDEVFDMVYADGYYYVTGYYTNITTFDNITMFAIQNGDAFVAKIDEQGNYQWVTKIASPYSEQGIAIDKMPDGRIVVTGEFTGFVTAGSYTVNSVNFSQDVFVACLSSSGNVEWLERIGGAGIDIVSDVKVDYNNDVYITGRFAGALTEGGNQYNSVFNPTTLLPSYDIFLSKLNAQGEHLWFK